MRALRGVTLVEMITVIVITGIIAAAVALFIRRPIEGYIDAARRAELSDIADTALRRITRDLRTALPNSIRAQESPPGSGIFYLEFLPTTDGGRYRAQPDSGGGGNILDFTNPAGDTLFDVIGPVPALAAGNLIVVYNLGPGTGSTDAYTGGNSAVLSSVVAPPINIAAKQYPFPSPGNRFYVIRPSPVTYVCNPVTGSLRRISGYAIQSGQPNDISAAPLLTASPNSLLALNVASCSFVYAQVNQRTGLVALTLQISQSGESVRLFQQVHVSNVP